jgi:hypothetical protein
VRKKFKAETNGGCCMNSIKWMLVRPLDNGSYKIRIQGELETELNTIHPFLEQEFGIAHGDRLIGQKSNGKIEAWAYIANKWQKVPGLPFGLATKNPEHRIFQVAPNLVAVEFKTPLKTGTNGLVVFFARNAVDAYTFMRNPPSGFCEITFQNALPQAPNFI